MPMKFPNTSRAYDEGKRTVRFWGHDGAMETTFVLSEDLLRQIEPALVSGESGSFAAFDANRPRIQRSAARAYSEGRKPFYVLTKLEA